MSKDGLDDILDQLRRAAPDFPEDKLYVAALRIRRDMGGESFYIKKASVDGNAFRLGEQLAAGVSLAQAFVNIGVSKATGYRLLSRTWRFR